MVVGSFEKVLLAPGDAAIVLGGILHVLLDASYVLGDVAYFHEDSRLVRGNDERSLHEDQNAPLTDGIREAAPPVANNVNHYY